MSDLFVGWCSINIENIFTIALDSLVLGDVSLVCQPQSMAHQGIGKSKDGKYLFFGVRSVGIDIYRFGDPDEKDVFLH